MKNGKLKSLVTLGVMIGLSTATIAQKNHFRDAEIAFNSEHYNSAIQSYKLAEVKEKDGSLKGLINYKMGLCYANILDYGQAEVYLDRADKLKFDDQNPQLYFDKGNIMMLQGEYQKAIALIEKFIAIKPNDQKAINVLYSCKSSVEMISNPTRHIVTEVVQLNTSEYEFAPHFMDKKCQTITYSATRPSNTGKEKDKRTGCSYADIWYSTIDNKGKWGAPQLMPSTINSEHNDATPYFNYKKTNLYYTRCNVIPKKNTGCDIYISSKQGSNWTEATLIALKPEGADSLSVGHPAISKKEDFMVFSSDLPGGFGGKDLWVTHYNKKEKTWEAPINLGAEINTIGDEVFPYLKANNQLYYSSNGKLGLGGLDVFSASYVNIDNWNNASNLGYPINSAQDDFGIIFENETDGYLTSNRNQKKLDDLFSFKLPAIHCELEVYVKSKANNQPIANASVIVTSNTNELREKKTDAEGKITFINEAEKAEFFTAERNYSISVSAEGYFSGEDKVTTMGITESKKFIEEFFLFEPIPYDLPEVRYDYADSALQVIETEVNSKDSLDYLYDILTQNPKLVIELMAHTDCRGSEIYNKKLSQGRANKCVGYLISKGIDPRRMKPVGYGESSPKKNLECKVIADMATEEEREVAHQKNRRTEFKVLSADFEK